MIQTSSFLEKAIHVPTHRQKRLGIFQAICRAHVTSASLFLSLPLDPLTLSILCFFLQTSGQLSHFYILGNHSIFLGVVSPRERTCIQIPLFASKIVHLGNHSQTQVYGVLAVSDFKEKHDLPWSWEKALSMRTEEWSHWIRPKISLDAYHVS